MLLPQLTTKHWILLISLIILTLGAGTLIAFTTHSTTPTNSLKQHSITIPPTLPSQPTPTPLSLTSTRRRSTPTPTISYKTIPRNATYIPSKPPADPLNPKHTYLITINPPFNNTANSFIGIHQGTIFEMNGLTDFPVGTELVVALFTQTFGIGLTKKIIPEPLHIDTIYTPRGSKSRGVGGTIYVEPPSCTQNTSCTTSLNTWRFIVDSQNLLPDEYVVLIRSNFDNTESNVKNVDALTWIWILPPAEPLNPNHTEARPMGE